ncbi:MAG: ZIP family metal transporter [bacterium]|nr:ZIP family metal transporter [bacterium]
MQYAAVWLYTIASLLLVSSISLIGVFFLSFNEKKLKKFLIFLVSFAVGALFGDAFIHLIPESFEKLGSSLATSMLILSGIFIFFALEKFVRWRHCHIPTSDHHTHPLATMNLIGDAVHNLVDGMLIGASYIVSIPLGISTTIAIVLHEIPQEIGEFGVLLHSGMPARKALFLNFLSALFALFGGVITLLISSRIENFALYLLPITAGGFIYIAGSDLMPELQHETKVSASIYQFLSILLGIGMLALLTLVG